MTKCLYSELVSLVPPSRSQEMSSLPDQLSEVTNYVVKLKARVEKLKDKRDSLLEPESRSLVGRTTSSRASLSPEIAIHLVGSALEVVFISDKPSSPIIFTEIIRVLQEGGAEVLNANLSIIGDTAFHSIHAEVEDSVRSNADGAAATSTVERLKKWHADGYSICSDALF